MSFHNVPMVSPHIYHRFPRFPVPSHPFLRPLEDLQRRCAAFEQRLEAAEQCRKRAEERAEGAEQRLQETEEMLATGAGDGDGGGNRVNYMR